MEDKVLRDAELRVSHYVAIEPLRSWVLEHPASGKIVAIATDLADRCMALDRRV
jgi:hypothetical protein